MAEEKNSANPLHINNFKWTNLYKDPVLSGTLTEELQIPLIENFCLQRSYKNTLWGHTNYLLVTQQLVFSDSS